jgi:outer membrane lipoprotein SlyB
MTVVATPGVVQARHHYHPNCAANRHHRAVVGTVAGAVAGGVIGNLITHGHGPGTIIGAGVGAVAGHQIGKNSRPC